MKVKSWTMLLIAVASLVAVVGCSSSNPKASDTEKEAQTEKAANEPRGKLSVAVYDRGNVPPSEGKSTDNRWTQWFKEHAPVDPEFVAIPRWESAQKYNTLFASGSAPDLIVEHDRAYRSQLYNQKQLLPLDDLIEKHSTGYKALLKEYPVLRKLGTMPDGKLYEIGLISELGPNHQLWLRADWLEKLNLEVPKTAEELYKVAEAFAKQDPDGNGAQDTFGMNISFVGGMIVDFMFGNVFTVFDKAPWVENDKGELVHDWDRKAAATAFKKRLYDNGIVDKDFLTDGKGDKAKQHFINGKLGIYGSNGGDYNSFKALKDLDPKAKVVALALPKTEFGSFSPVVSSPISTFAVVNAKAKDPIAVIKYIDFLHDPQTSSALRSGIEGEHYTLNEQGCPATIDAEKNKVERVYISDVAVMVPSNKKFEHCDSVRNPPPPKDNSAENKADYELRKEFAELIKSADSAYLDPARPMAGVIPNGFLPSLPQDLHINQTNGYQAMIDTLQKAIVSGSSYTVDKAISDAKNAWKLSNGEKIDQWYGDWYRDNKDKTILVKDLYSVLK